MNLQTKFVLWSHHNVETHDLLSPNIYNRKLNKVLEKRNNCIHAKNQINSNIWKRTVTNDGPPQTPCCGTVSQLSVGLLPQSKPCYLDISCWLPVVHQLRNLYILFVISNCRLLCQQERVSINGELKNSIFYLFSLYVY